MWDEEELFAVYQALHASVHAARPEDTDLIFAMQEEALELLEEKVCTCETYGMGKPRYHYACPMHGQGPYGGCRRSCCWRVLVTGLGPNGVPL